MRLKINENIFKKLVLENQDVFDIENMYKLYASAENERDRNFYYNYMVEIHGKNKTDNIIRYFEGKYHGIKNSKVDDMLGEKILNISNKGIDDLGVEISSYQNIVELRAENNNIEYIPPHIGQLKKLKVLDLSRNIIKSLPYEIEELKNLRELSLNNNLIKELPYTVGKLTSLTTLSISNNELRELSRGILNCEHLKFLYLSNNNLTELPSGIEDMNITVIDITDNPMNPKYVARLKEMMPRTSISF